MALDNLISVAFTPAELAAFDTALAAIETLLQGKVINLTPAERQRFAAVSNETLPWVQKCRDYITQMPGIVPAYLDITRLDADITARQDISPRLARTKSILESLDDTKVLLGSDIFDNCIFFYRAVKAAAQANVPGSTTVYQDLAVQFPGRPHSRLAPQTDEKPVQNDLKAVPNDLKLVQNDLKAVPND